MTTDADTVWLVYSSDLDDGELIDRARLPIDAERYLSEFHSAALGWPDERVFEVWVVDDAKDGSRA